MREPGRLEPLQTVPEDMWAHRALHMRCATCMWWVEKKQAGVAPANVNPLGRCRRHAPTLSGWPAVFGADWCGDHKLDQEKA